MYATQVGDEYLVVATGVAKGEASAKKELLAALERSADVACARKFDVPDGDRSLVFGSFDSLIRLTDDLQKYDSQVDSLVHRLERQMIELDPQAEFRVKSQRTVKTFDEYMSAWQWDDAKYPRTVPIVQIAANLMVVTNKLDEQTREKTTTYNELKMQKANFDKNSSGGLASRDLTDVFAPEKVRMTGGAEDDFIYTEHLTTICVIVPRSASDDFRGSYERMTELVVPGSAKHFASEDDKDGNQLWRVVMFKSCVEAFKKACRDMRLVTRDFEYSEEGYTRIKAQRAQVTQQLKSAHDMLKGLYQAAWSDAVVGWIHIKAMRAFVESILRFGVPARFASFFVAPRSGQLAQCRSALNSVLAPKGGQTSMDSATEQDDGEEYFPYVSFSFTPFTVARVA